MKITDLKGLSVDVPVTFTLKRVEQATEPDTGLPQTVWNSELGRKEPSIRIVFQLEGVDKAYPRPFIVLTLAESTLEQASMDDLKAAVTDHARYDILDAVGKSVQEQVKQQLEISEESE